MAGKRFVVQLAHFAAVAVTLVILCELCPKVLFYFSGTACFLLYTFVAYNTFSFSKWCFLNERIRPDNKAILITGCDTGFGNALAKRLDSRGFHVFASCLFPDGEGATELKLTCSNRIRILHLDVTKDDSVQEALSFVKLNLGSKNLWAVVNNAGVYKGLAFHLSSLEDFQVCMDVNVFGPIRVAKAFLPLIRKSRGRVVNITSGCARLSLSDMCAYSMSKHAVLEFTDCLDQHMDPFGVKVISIEPESFTTGMFNEKNLSRHMDDLMDKLSEDVLATYGEDYIKKSMKAGLTAFRIITNRKIDVVIDDIERAITEKYPEHVYKTRINIITRVLLYMHEIMPYGLFKFLINGYKLVVGFPSLSPRS